MKYPCPLVEGKRRGREGDGEGAGNEEKRDRWIRSFVRPFVRSFVRRAQLLQQHETQRGLVLAVTMVPLEGKLLAGELVVALASWLGALGAPCILVPQYLDTTRRRRLKNL